MSKLKLKISSYSCICKKKTMKNKNLILTVLFTVLMNTSFYGQITSKEVDKLVKNAIKKFNVAGAAVGIVKDGKIIHAKGYGVKSIKTKKIVNEHTQFAIASNSKAFTTTALAILVDKGKLSWQDKVKKYIPEFTMYNSYVTENFTIQDLLTHRSGLGLGAGDLMFFPHGSDFTVKDVLTVFQHFKPQSAFRTKFDYDNLLYLIAGEVIVRVSGMSWEDFVNEQIMKPLEMDNSYSSIAQITDKSNLATAHTDESGSLKTLPDIDYKIGSAGGIYSNVDDLCNWMLVHLNKGKYGNDLSKQLFSERNSREMFKIHTTLNADPNSRYNSHFAGYGLGWFLKDTKGNMSASHTGGLPGMLSKTVLIPDLKLGVVVLTNTSNSGAGVFSAVTKTIVDSYLGLDDFGWTDKYFDMMNSRKNNADKVSSKVWETVKTANSKHIKTDDYVGVYKDKWFGKVEVYLKNNELWFKSLRSPMLTGKMQYYKANAFAIKWEYRAMDADAFTIFSLDEEGKAQTIKMKGISPNIDFSYDFQDLFFERLEKK